MNIINTSRNLPDHIANQLNSKVAVAQLTEYKIKTRLFFDLTQHFSWPKTINFTPVNNHLFVRSDNFAPLIKLIQNKTILGAPFKYVRNKPLAQQNHRLVNFINDTNHKAAIATYTSFVINKRNALLADENEEFDDHDSINGIVNPYKSTKLCINFLPRHQCKFNLSTT